MDNLFLGLIVVVAILNVIIFHNVFHVYYFDFSQGFFQVCFKAIIIAALEVTVVFVGGAWIIDKIGILLGGLFGFVWSLVKIIFIIVAVIIAGTILITVINNLIHKDSKESVSETKIDSDTDETLSPIVKDNTSSVVCNGMETESHERMNCDSSITDKERFFFDVELTEAGPNKMQVIKEVHKITGLGIKETKDIVDDAPAIIKRDISEENANIIKDELESIEAKITVCPKKISEGTMFCVNCGAKIGQHMKFCKYCGHKNEMEEEIVDEM